MPKYIFLILRKDNDSLLFPWAYTTFEVAQAAARRNFPISSYEVRRVEVKGDA